LPFFFFAASAELRNRGYTAEWRQMAEQERVEALAWYRADHPLYGRIVLWLLARLHRLSGDRVRPWRERSRCLSVRLTPKGQPRLEPPSGAKAV
jgi:hypothetical protein